MRVYETWNNPGQLNITVRDNPSKWEMAWFDDDPPPAAKVKFWDVILGECP